MAKQVTWKTSDTSETTRSAPLVRKSYGRKSGAYVDFHGRNKFIPLRLIVSVTGE